jgi:hypothetical protein
MFRGTMPELENQIRDATPDPKHPEKRFKDLKNPFDLLDALEYGAAFGPYYREPKTVTQITPASIAVESYQRKIRGRKSALVTRELG